jgi:glutamate-1-semialdehyde 2,1-aminomutase
VQCRSKIHLVNIFWKISVKTLVIVQARMGSTRFPGKVMTQICGMPMIELLLARLKGASLIDQIVLATSKDASNDLLVEHVEKIGYTVFRGDEDDVLDRHYQAAKKERADLVVRITGDCPLVDPAIVDKVIAQLKEEGVDYASNINPPTFPDGLDTEVFTFQALEIAWNEASTLKEREHVTPFIRESGQFSCLNITCDTDYSGERWTVDEPDDFEVVRKIFEYFNPRNNFSWLEVLDLCKKKPEQFMANRHIDRNEGSKIDKGQNLWNRAKRVIPGGNMLLSKRPEMFLPEQWPTYFSRAKGCKVWDLDGREYIDMSIMGVGTNTLGYGHPEVDDAVRRVVDVGNMSTLNCPEEVYLAEKLIELHPWADMARFARSGGEANAIAIRIARAAVGKDKVAVCGYHGWHDWYLSANLRDDKNLDGHLLPGLEPKGVPENLCDTVYPFSYNNFSELDELVKTHDIGVIKMEVSRNVGPEGNFLHKVRKLASEQGIVLIFDECTSGFRQSFGGLHKTFGVEPDMAVFGKALGNGYPITAVIGRREIMDVAQSTFISSTFWTERIGPVAALKTLEVMETEKSWEKITQTGQNIMAGWQTLAEKYGLPITINGLPALASFTFDSSNTLAYKTLITQEMQTRGYLAGNSFYASTAHSPAITSNFFEQLDPIFGLIKECEEGRDIMSLLQGPICHVGFKRLN